MRTHMLMVWIMTGLTVSCTRKMIDVPVHPAMTPADTKGNSRSDTDGLDQKNDDSNDLANQLRDPDLLNRLDDPNSPVAGNASSKPNAGKPVVIRGSDLPPEPMTPPKSTPQPPLGKPSLPTDNDGSSKPPPGTGN